MATTTSSSPILHCTSKSRLVTWPIAWTIDNMSHRCSSVSSSIYNYTENCFTTISYTKNYSERKERKGARAYSESTESIPNNSFTLNLNQNLNENYVSMAIYGSSSCNASVKLYIITASNEKKCLYESSPRNVNWTYDGTNKYRSSLIISKFISDDELYNPANGYLPEDQLTIVAEFGFLVKDTDVQSTFEESLENIQSTVNSKTRKAYAQLLATGKLSDVTLIVDGKAIPAHKAILAIRSSVLAVMFEGDTKEALENRVQITDVKVNVFEQMLNFIYTGTVPSFDQSTAEELLVAADKYQLDDLKAICENYLCGQLSAASAPNLFLFAEAINALKLKECALKFINSRATDVFKTMASESDQLEKMIRFLALKNQEEDTVADGK